MANREQEHKPKYFTTKNGKLVEVSDEALSGTLVEKVLRGHVRPEDIPTNLSSGNIGRGER